MDSGVGRNPRGFFFCWYRWQWESNNCWWLVASGVGTSTIPKCPPWLTPAEEARIMVFTWSVNPRCSNGCLGRELNGHLGNFANRTQHTVTILSLFNEKEANLLSIAALRSITCPSHKLSSKIISKPTGYSHLPPSIQSAKGLIKSLAPLTISFLSDLDPHVKWFRLKAQAPLPMSKSKSPNTPFKWPDNQWIRP